MYQALYRSFRPETFENILGQEHIVKILKNQLNTNTTSHAYLFCGTRGTGKTSTARILAKGLNCLASEGERPCGVCENCKSIKNGNFMDVIEIDAASNNGVENIRELRESVKYPPVKGRYKVYIIDEVHMLSPGAFNALLKTLEEPPENVMFILATTEAQKLPATILSRCLRLDFKRVPERQLKIGLNRICGELGIEVQESALGLIAAGADGSVRDALSLLDQCISTGEKVVKREDVLNLIGASGEEVFLELTDYVSLGQVAKALILLDKVLSDGKDVRQLMRDWIHHFRNLLMTKYIKNPEDILNMSFENVERIRSQSERLPLATINNSILELSKTSADAKWSTQPRILLELAMIRMGSGDICGGVTQRMEPSSSAPPQKTPVKNEMEKVFLEKTGKEKSSLIPDAGLKLQPLDLELEELWFRVFEDGEVLKSSFNLIRMGTTLLEVTEEQFTVQANTEMAGSLLEDNRQDLVELMKKHTGKELRMKVLLPGSETVDKGKQAEKLAKEISHKLGINIEVR